MVRVEGDVMLDERVRRVVKLPESEDPACSDLERMISIMFAYRECRFLRGLGCERERKNDLHGISDGHFRENHRYIHGLTFRVGNPVSNRRDLPKA